MPNRPSPERLKAALFAAISGAGVAGFTYGALELRITDRDDLLPSSLGWTAEDGSPYVGRGGCLHWAGDV